MELDGEAGMKKERLKGGREEESEREWEKGRKKALNTEREERGRGRNEKRSEEKKRKAERGGR